MYTYIYTWMYLRGAGEEPPGLPERRQRGGRAQRPDAAAEHAPPGLGAPVFPKQGFWTQGYSVSWKFALGSCENFCLGIA